MLLLLLVAQAGPDFIINAVTITNPKIANL